MNSTPDRQERLWTFETHDPEYFAEVVSPVAPGFALCPYQGCEFYGQIKATKLQTLAIFKTQISHGRIVSLATRDFYGLTMPLHNNTFEIVHQGQLVLFDSDRAHFLDADKSFDFRAIKPCNALVAHLDRPWLDDYAQKLAADQNSNKISCEFLLPLTSESGSSLRRYLNFFWHEIEQDGFLLRSPLALQEFQNSLASLILGTLEETANNGDRQPARDCSPHYLRRAEEYLAAHLCSPVSTADLAEVVGVSSRTLNRAFNKYRGMTPIQFLKERRMEACHLALLAADGQTTSVTDIALQYGFHHLGRFSVEYRQYFQELPSDTLRRRSSSRLSQSIFGSEKL